MRRPVGVALVGMALVLLIAAPPASADSDGSQGWAGASVSGGSASVVVGTASGGGGLSSASPYSSCESSSFGGWVADEVVGAVTSGLFGTAASVEGGAYQAGTLGLAECTRVGGGEDTFVIGLPAPSGADAAAVAASGLVVGVPEVGVSPPAGGTQLVGVETWFWVVGAVAVSASASLPGVSATVVASPATLHLVFGDGSRLDCPGRGRAYDVGRPAAGQVTDCGHVYDAWGDVVVEASLDWVVTWSASTGESGVLPMIVRTTSIPLHVEEAQAVTD